MKKSKEEKMLEKAEKELAKQKAALEELGLDFAEYDIDKIDKLNGESARRISSKLTSSLFYWLGDAFASSEKNRDRCMQVMAEAQVEENLMIIRQNEIIIRLLSKLVDSEN